jgi:N-terminal acetyltransferase B complex catalytic subunit
MDLLEKISGPNTAEKHDCSSHGHAHGDGHEHEHGHGHHHPTPTPGQLDNVDAFFVDLFVRCNNGRAVEMYEKLGYSVYRRVVE